MEINERRTDDKGPKEEIRKLTRRKDGLANAVESRRNVQ